MRRFFRWLAGIQGPVTINMTIHAPDAASFRTTRRETTENVRQIIWGERRRPTQHSPQEKRMAQLGQTVTDKITGFAGIVTGRVEYISGCNQCLVTPRVGADGAFKEAQWFDEQRLHVDTSMAILVLDNGRTPGFDKAAPKR